MLSDDKGRCPSRQISLISSPVKLVLTDLTDRLRWWIFVTQGAVTPLIHLAEVPWGWLTFLRSSLHEYFSSAVSIRCTQHLAVKEYMYFKILCINFSPSNVHLTPLSADGLAYQNQAIPRRSSALTVRVLHASVFATCNAEVNILTKLCWQT